MKLTNGVLEMQEKKSGQSRVRQPITVVARLPTDDHRCAGLLITWPYWVDPKQRVKNREAVARYNEGHNINYHVQAREVGTTIQLHLCAHARDRSRDEEAFSQSYAEVLAQLRVLPGNEEIPETFTLEANLQILEGRDPVGDAPSRLAGSTRTMRGISYRVVTSS